MAQKLPNLTEASSKSRSESVNWSHFLFRRHLPLETETALFILANMLDYFATYFLLAVGGFRESNPIALWFLEGWGLVKGLLMYKLALVTTVCLTTQIIYLKRPKVAQAILVLGAIAVFCVVIYSVRLYLQHGEGTVGFPLDFLEDDGF